MNPILYQAFDSVSLHELAGFSVNSSALRELLEKSGEVRRIRDGFRTGILTEGEIRAFVQEILDGFKSGEALAGDVSLAAIAVALEPFQPNQESFVEEFIGCLSKIRLSEIRKGPGVALACLKARASLTMNHAKGQKTDGRALSQEKVLFSGNSQGELPGVSLGNNVHVSYDAAA